MCMYVHFSSYMVYLLLCWHFYSTSASTHIFVTGHIFPTHSCKMAVPTGRQIVSCFAFESSSMRSWSYWSVLFIIEFMKRQNNLPCSVFVWKVALRQLVGKYSIRTSSLLTQFLLKITDVDVPCPLSAQCLTIFG